MSLSTTIKTMLEAGCSAEQLAQVVLAHEREADETKKEKRAKRAAQKRVERERRLMSSNVAATSSDNVRHDATACDISSPSSPPPNGFSPHPPSINIIPPLPITPTSTPSPRLGRGSRLPENWSPSLEDHSFAERLGVVSEIEKFRDYWHSQPGQKGVKLDWSATWRNWCRRAAENKPVAKPSAGITEPFPETGTIRYSPWAAKVRELGTGRDPDWIADQFRTWAKSKDIDFYGPGIGQMFYSFARAQKPI